MLYYYNFNYSYVLSFLLSKCSSSGVILIFCANVQKQENSQSIVSKRQGNMINSNDIIASIT